MSNPVEAWKSEKHPLDAWADIEQYAARRTPLKEIDSPDLERMKWHGFFYRKRDVPGRYMNRIRVTANELTAEQAREIAMIAYQFGHGIVDLTTRANLQVQGLDIEHLPKVVRRLERVGMTSLQTGHDNVRNVFGHPLSGRIPGERIDTRPLCHQVTQIFLGSHLYADLPRKVNIAFNGTDHHPAHYWTQDLSFLATQHDGRVYFHLLLAGTQGQTPQLAWHLPVLIAPEQVVPVAQSLLDLYRQQGSREKRNQSRLRFLVERLGVGGVLEWLEQDLPFRLLPCVTQPAPAASHESLVGWTRQSDPGLWAMGLSVPLGRMTWRQLEGLAVLSRRWGSGQLRTTTDQGIVVIDIASGFRDAAATDAAGLGLSIHADPFERNTMACTGSQFCNIAVTETKGHMFQLIEKLRKRSLKLHGIRIHMSGCPSSCAQHFTADIGLKGVRVRRLLGTREGFDVYLGGGLAGQVHLALPYRLGVDVDQLPALIEQVVGEYYLKHRPGQTFSAYWRERLQAAAAEKVGEEDYQQPVWLCESCQYRHSGEDPPVFCPSCAGVRRGFARLEDERDEPPSAALEPPAEAREDGFVPAARLSQLPPGGGRTVCIQGTEYALLNAGGQIRCIDSACPHEGACLADGTIREGTIVCPWHDWQFDLATGCSIDPPGHRVQIYSTLVEGDTIFIRPAAPDAAGPPPSGPAARPRQHSARPAEALLRVIERIDEAPGVVTFRLDNRQGKIPFDRPGKFVQVCVPSDQGELWRSFTVSSSPHDPRTLDLTIKLQPGGIATPYLFDHARPGAALRIKGCQGGFWFDPECHAEPLTLVSAGSGITPMMSIVRYLSATGQSLPVTFFYGARSEEDILFRQQCLELAERHDWFRYVVTLSAPGPEWDGERGRIDGHRLQALVGQPAAFRFFLCGPDDFMHHLSDSLLESGVPPDRIHTESFQARRVGAPA